jgi:hypothetical protein
LAIAVSASVDCPSGLGRLMLIQPQPEPNKFPSCFQLSKQNQVRISQTRWRIM